MTESEKRARVAVVGVGGAGCNVISSLHDAGSPVDTIGINTDRYALEQTRADKKLYICKEVLHGEGARGDAVLGKRCADIHIEEIRESLSVYDAVFVVAGLGGGTGSGAMSVVIDAAQSQGIDAYAIAISPFFFEANRRIIAMEAWNHVRAVCSRSIVFSNDTALETMPNSTPDEAFDKINSDIGEYILGRLTEIEVRTKDRTGKADADVRYPKSAPISA